MTIDIVDIKKQIKDGMIIPYISSGFVYLSNKCGEVVSIGKVEELKVNACYGCKHEGKDWDVETLCANHER